MKKFKPDNYYVSFRNKTYHLPKNIVEKIVNDYKKSISLPLFLITIYLLFIIIYIKL